MQITSTFPHEIEHHENVWIPMPDGAHLAARIWRPRDATEHPVPAILEYIPYRKRDLTRFNDEMAHPYFAGHGYASVRVDLRGSGESDGVLRDEYLQQELDDGVDVLRWIAAQPWCTGSVGMYGISWGGFNGLQIAAMQPPELQAVITICSTDDRYADDVHYMGGCLLGDNLSWASHMFSQNTCPPDPAIVGDRWREMWFERLEGSGLWLENWLNHQRRDGFWKHGSVCEDYSAIKCPIFAISGWADGYSNAVFRLLANLDVPRRGLIGPWSHKFPHIGVPGPAIGFLQEALRWWDHWLKGIDRGAMDEPMLRVWMQDSVGPTTMYQQRPGRWVGEPSWPSPNVTSQEHRLARYFLAEPGQPIEPQGLRIQSPLSVGLFAGKWCSYAAPPDLPHDQREEDGGALVLETEPLEEQLEILGPPVIELDLESDQPVAMLAARLSDVGENHEATRVTYGVLNLTHRDSHETPSPLEPGRRYRIRLQLNDIAQVFPAGHQLRLSLSTSYWPLAWPPPEPVQLIVHTGESSLTLPVRPPRDEDRGLRPFEAPAAATPLQRTRIEQPEHEWIVIRNLARDVSTLKVINTEGVYRIDDIDTQIEERCVEKYTHYDNDFDSVRGETRWVRGFSRDGWAVRTVTKTILRSTKTHFHLTADLDAWEGDERVFVRTWSRTIPRDHV